MPEEAQINEVPQVDVSHDEKQGPPETSRGGPLALIRKVFETISRQGDPKTTNIATAIVSQATQIDNQLRNILPDIQEHEKEQIRAEVRKTEIKLGINTPAQRALEASLFIDKPFMDIAQLREDEHPEEMFGIKAWKGWVEARLAAEEIKRELTSEDIRHLHVLMTQGLAPNLRGRVRNNISFGRDYVVKGAPITFTQEQIDAINQNPLLTISFTDDAQRQGYILYPTSTDQISYDKCLATLPVEAREEIIYDPMADANDKLVRALLENFLKHFNSPIPTSRTEVIAKAADLQREFVSIHVFGDGNGRLSKLLMNAYLKKAGIDPAILENGEQDLLYSKDTWEKQVEEGIIQYSEYRKKVDQGKESPREVFFANEYIEFFDMVYRRHHALLLPENPLIHEEYRKYLENIQNEYKQFVDFIQQRDIPQIQTGETSVEHVGGLISQEYIEMWGDTRPEIQDAIRKRFYHQAEIYRGGLAAEIGDIHDVLTVFTQPTALDSSYRLLNRAGLHSMSLQALSTEEAKRVLSELNDIIISDFYQRRAPNELNNLGGLEASIKELYGKISDSVAETRALEALRKGEYLAFLMLSHQQVYTSEDLAYAGSPGVSTALDEDVAVKFGTPTTDQYNENFIRDKLGIVVSALLPKGGTYYLPTGGSTPIMKDTMYQSLFREREFIVPGAIDPNSITSVTVYNQEEKILAKATREGSTITLRDYQKNISERYVFDEGGILRLSSRSTINNSDADLTEVKN